MIFITFSANEGSTYVNNSNYWLLIADMALSAGISPASLVAGASVSSTAGMVTSPDNVIRGYSDIAQYSGNMVVSDNSSGDPEFQNVYQYAANEQRLPKIIPPHWSIQQVASGYGWLLTDKEVEQRILNGGRV